MSALLGLGGTKQKAQVSYSGLNVSTSKRDMPIPIFWGQRSLNTNTMWYNDFQKHKQSAKGKGGGGKSGQYTYSAAVELALCEGVLDGIGICWSAGSTTTVTTLAALNMTLYTGTASQAPEPWVVSHYPAQARSYAYTAYLFCPKLDLGQTAEVPDNTFEGIRSAGFSYTVTNPGWINPETHAQGTAIDVLMSDVVVDWLTNLQYGMGFVSGDLASITQYSTYLRAQGLVYSPLLNTQEKGTEVMNRWAQESNSWIYFDGLKFHFIPLGDVAITANGVTYTPDIDVAYSFDHTNMKELQINRKDPADCYNRTILNFMNRILGYVSDPVEYRDDTLVDLYGLRDNTAVEGTDICDPTVAKILVQLAGKREAYIRNTYKWKTSYRYIRILPGTIVALSENNIGLSDHQVRVTKVEEGDDGIISVEAEEFPGGVGTYTTSTIADSVPPTFPNLNTDPGSVNTPAIIEPNSSFTQGLPTLYVAASGGANWGGAQVHISFDGLAFSHIGDVTAEAIQGLLTAPLADHAGLDTTNTLSVDCTESLATPTTVTNADADALRTLSLITGQPALISGAYEVPNDGELLAFGDTAPTGTYSADLTYLPRGVYGTAHSAHSSGDQFTVMDVSLSSGSVVEYKLDPQYIGTRIFFKLLSYNVFGGPPQDLSLAVLYAYTPTGLGYGTGTGGVPATPTGLVVGSGVLSALAAWAANAAADNVLTYDLWRAPGPGGSFGSAVSVFSGLTLNRTDPSLTAGGQYTYFLTATNAAGTSGPTAGVDVTVGATVVNRFGFGFERDLSFGILGASFIESTVNFNWTMPTGLPESEIKITGTGPSSQTDLDLQVNGVSVGTIRFAISATSATFIKGSPSSVPAGQTSSIVLPANLNGMTGRLYGSVVGTQ